MANLFASSVSTETDFVYVKSIKWYRLGGDTRTQTLNTDSTLRTRPEMKRDELTAHRLRKNRLFYFFFTTNSIVGLDILNKIQYTTVSNQVRCFNYWLHQHGVSSNFFTNAYKDTKDQLFAIFVTDR